MNGPLRVVVLVRGINVGRNKQVAMTDLAAALADAGGTAVRTYLRSGNAVMDVDHPAVRVDLHDGRAADRPLAGLGAVAERSLLARTGVSARVLVVTADHLRAVAAANPFPDLEATPKLLHVLFCETQLDAAELDARVGLRHGDDELAVGDHVLYAAYRTGRSIGSPLDAVLPRVGTTTTARNWSTVQALVRLSDR